MRIVALEMKNIGADIDTSMFYEFGDFDVYEKSTIDNMQERCKDAEVIIINKLPINKYTISELNNLKLILVTATGYDNVDTEYCKSRGIAVCNVKGYSTKSVIQHTFAMLFYLYEKLAYYDKYVRTLEYTKSDIFTHFDNTFHELAGKTWGIVGLGEIGRGVAAIASAFGCRVIFYSTSGNNNSFYYERVEFDELLRESDVISIHAPLNNNTRGLFNKAAFKQMKESAVLINVGRGPIVNESDLVEALNNNEIQAAGLDVIEREPMEKDSPLIKLKDDDRLFVTPHIAWATKEARTRCMLGVYENLKAFLNGENYNRIV